MLFEDIDREITKQHERQFEILLIQFQNVLALKVIG